MRGDHLHRTRAWPLLALALATSLLSPAVGARAAAADTLAVSLGQSATTYDAATNQAKVSVTLSASGAATPFSYSIAVRGAVVASGSADAPVTITATNPCSVYTVSLTATVTDALGATGSAATTLSRSLCPPPPAVKHATDRIIAGATLTQASFLDQLRAKGSPALAQGAAIYNTLVAGRVNPAFALGTFQAESGSGTRGYAVTTKNWGNILYHDWEAAYGAVPYAPGNGYTYAKYPDWLSSVKAYVHLIHIYDDSGYTTVSSASAHWLGTTEGSTRHLTYLNNITKVMSSLPDDAVPVMKTLSVPALSRSAVAISWTATDNVLVAGYQAKARLGTGAYGAVTETTAKSTTLTLADGTWTIAVRAVDDAGNWSKWKLATVKVDGTAPAMTKLAPSAHVVRSADGKVTVRWAATDAAGVTSYQWRTRRTSTGAWSTPAGTTAATRTFSLAPDTWYIAVRARDAAGNYSEWRETSVIVPADDRAYSFGSATRRGTAATEYRRTYTATSSRNAKLATTFTGTGLVIVGRAGPGYGRFRVTVDGVSAVVDTGVYAGKRATSVHTQVLLYSVTLPAGAHSVTITNLGTSGRATIVLDGIGFVR